MKLLHKLFSTEELVVPMGILTKEAKAATEIHQLTAETKIRKCPKFRVVQTSVLITHQFILVYFSNKIILYVFYTLLSKFLIHVFFHTYLSPLFRIYP